MFETIAEFVQAWKKETANTQKMMDVLTEPRFDSSTIRTASSKNVS